MSKFWDDQNPVRPHLLRAGGTLREVRDIRSDLVTAFNRVQLDIEGAGSVPPVGTLLQLAAMPSAQYPEGTGVYVVEVEDRYFLLEASLVEDLVTVITASDKPGFYWVAENYGRWDDQQGPIAQGTGVAALTLQTYRNTPYLMYFMRHDQDDVLCFNYQFSHTWDYTKVVFPHLHVLPAATPAADRNVRVSGYYAWSRPNRIEDPLPNLAGWTPFAVDIPILSTNYVYVQRIISLGAVTPPSWARQSTSLLIYFKRAGTDPADTYTDSNPDGVGQANLALLSADVHFRKGADGSITEIPA